MDQGKMKQNKMKQKLAAYGLFIVIYAILSGLLFYNGTSDKMARVLTPILFIYTVIMLGVSICILWKKQKTIWWRVMIGYGFYMLTYILFTISTFTRAFPMSELWQIINAVFIVALLVYLIMYTVRKVVKAKSISTKVGNALGISMLWAASVGIFFFSLSVKPMISNERVVEKGTNLLGHYLVIQGRDNQFIGYKEYIYCGKEDYLDAEIDGKYSMARVTSTLYPIAYLEGKLDTPSESLEAFRE